MQASYYITLASAFGTFSIVWRDGESGPKVHRITLSNAELSSEARVKAAFPNAQPRLAGVGPVAALGEQIQAFLVGQAIALKLDLLALEVCSDFQRRVLMAEYAIPRGWVSTYGRIAKHVGIAQGGRAVGNALAQNPFPIVIPCHRAIRSNGTLGGYQGGLEMKRALLAFEGVEISEQGRICMEKVYY